MQYKVSKCPGEEDQLHEQPIMHGNTRRASSPGQAGSGRARQAGRQGEGGSLAVPVLARYDGRNIQQPSLLRINKTSLGTGELHSGLYLLLQLHSTALYSTALYCALPLHQIPALLAALSEFLTRLN